MSPPSVGSDIDFDIDTDTVIVGMSHLPQFNLLPLANSYFQATAPRP